MDLVPDLHDPAAGGAAFPDAAIGARIDAILAAFDRFEGRYCRAEVDEAIALREAIAPRLIGVLESVAADPGAYARKDRWVQLYAAMLLGCFREPRAHAALVEVSALPGELLGDLFGDVVTEDLPGLLYQTGGGDLSRLRGLAERPDASLWGRLGALKAMVYAALDGAADRVEVLRFGASLLDPARARSDDPDFQGLVACRLLKLHPAEVMDEVARAYDLDLICPGIVGREEFDEALAHAREEWLERGRRELRARLAQDVHERMAWWSCFRDRAAARGSDGREARERLSAAERRAEQARRRKRKQARAARRKNRRR